MTFYFTFPVPWQSGQSALITKPPIQLVHFRSDETFNFRGETLATAFFIAFVIDVNII